MDVNVLLLEFLLSSYYSNLKKKQNGSRITLKMAYFTEMEEIDNRVSNFSLFFFHSRTSFKKFTKK